MTAPRIEVRLDRIAHNARTLVDRLDPLGITVCGVTKATLGSPAIAREFLSAGVTSLGESRIENVENLRDAGITAPITLIRSPMISQSDRVVAGADSSLNTDLGVIDRLSASAVRQDRRHGVILMVEMGDLREGLMPHDLHAAVDHVLGLPSIELQGIGTNLACQSGIVPDAENMAELSALAVGVEEAFQIELAIVSGGNSANVGWSLEPKVDVGRINHLRLGESILLGREPTRRAAIDGLHGDAISLVGEVIESKRKPGRSWGRRAQTAFGEAIEAPATGGDHHRTIIALGRQDTDTDGLTAPPGYEILGASSDHLVLATSTAMPDTGAELRFQLDYSALLRAMTSPFVRRANLCPSVAPTPGDCAP